MDGIGHCFMRGKVGFLIMNSTTRLLYSLYRGQKITAVHLYPGMNPLKLQLGELKQNSSQFAALLLKKRMDFLLGFSPPLR